MTREELGEIAEINGFTFEEAVDAILASIKMPFAVACFKVQRAKAELREAAQA